MNRDNKKYRHQSKSFTIASGTNSEVVDIPLLTGQGDVVAGCIEILGDKPTDKLINASVKDNGGRVEDPTSIQNWEQRQGGSYKESLKPLSIPGNQTIQVEFSASSNLSADLVGQIVLLLEKDCD